jgi:hypothetical protein
MATHFDSNYDQYDKDVQYVYAPDVEIQRKKDSHTLRKCRQHAPTEHVVKIFRPKCKEGIPITEIDHYFNDKFAFIEKHHYNMGGATATLSKKEIFDSFTFHIEELCSSKTVTFNKKSNMVVTSYKVPIIGHMCDDHHVLSSSMAASSDAKSYDKFIMIRGKLYSINKYYREAGLEYGELIIPPNYFSSNSNVASDEHAYVPHKSSNTSDSITFSFHHDVLISSIVVQPEMMKFKKVHTDNSYTRYDRQNTDLLRKQKYAINVLENEPGFISKFELAYRSELTNGKWVKHGIYNGNVSVVDSVKIVFDEIQVKEIRIIPISFHKSFDKIRLSFIGKGQVQPHSDEVFVTYELFTPRDGVYLKYRSKIPHKTGYTTKYSEPKLYYDEHQDKTRFMKMNIRDAMRDY